MRNDENRAPSSASSQEPRLDDLTEQSVSPAQGEAVKGGAADIFLDIKGIKGESTSRGRGGEIEI